MTAYVPRLPYQSLVNQCARLILQAQEDHGGRGVGGDIHVLWRKRQGPAVHHKGPVLQTDMAIDRGEGIEERRVANIEASQVISFLGRLSMFAAHRQATRHLATGIVALGRQGQHLLEGLEGNGNLPCPAGQQADQEVGIRVFRLGFEGCTAEPRGLCELTPGESLARLRQCFTRSRN